MPTIRAERTISRQLCCIVPDARCAGGYSEWIKYIGKKLDGRYEIRELIGVGGMANVYKAYDVVEARTVAVKILREEYMNNDEFMRRFRNESRAISLLDHPNIVKVYDVIFSNRIQSIVMEYIDGITLKDYIDQEKVLRWKEAVHFTVQILRALQHAHDKGIVHRDIKPHNIMLLSDGTIKITDFGIARFPPAPPRPSPTKPSARCTSVPSKPAALHRCPQRHLFAGRDDVRNAYRQAAV